MDGCYEVKVFASMGEAEVSACGEKYRLTLADLEKCGITDGDSVSEEGLAALAFADDKLRCIKKALVYLSYRAHPTRKMEEKLKKAGFSSSVIEPTLELLVRKGYLDDETLCREYAVALQKSKQYGLMRIKKELYAKGFDRECIELALDELEETPEDIIEGLLRKRFPHLDPEDRQGRAKAVAYLSARGYGYDEINNVISAMERE